MKSLGRVGFSLVDSLTCQEVSAAGTIREDSKLTKCVSAIGVMVVLAAQMLAQGGPSGALSGTVEDSSHAMIAGADSDIVDIQQNGAAAQDEVEVSHWSLPPCCPL